MSGKDYVTLRARWKGDPPQIGEYLMSSTRPRHAYRVVAVEGNYHRGEFQFTCRRVKAHEVTDGAVVHPWKWDPRTKKGSRAA